MFVYIYIIDTCIYGCIFVHRNEMRYHFAPILFFEVLLKNGSQHDMTMTNKVISMPTESEETVFTHKRVAIFRSLHHPTFFCLDLLAILKGYPQDYCG